MKAPVDPFAQPDGPDRQAGALFAQDPVGHRTDFGHVNDLPAVLRFAQNPRDRLAGFRVLQFVPGVGPGTAGIEIQVPVSAGRSGEGWARPPKGKCGSHAFSFQAKRSGRKVASIGWRAPVTIS
ncbi:hypothetical protein D2T31_13600 [Sinirhodobacter populi]|uniref:Uncharacterized protein n=1 Tax=Paenirhodobacter populi TaxID=2306993 RepID=A0A443K6M5_9RHOB|nr:hypothetical protein D2T31_13600 [Sinirhodobacter populi]